MYKVVDFHNDTVMDGFSTEGKAWTWIYSMFTKDCIKDLSLHVVKEDNYD